MGDQIRSSSGRRLPLRPDERLNDKRVRKYPKSQGKNINHGASSRRTRKLRPDEWRHEKCLSILAIRLVKPERKHPQTPRKSRQGSTKLRVTLRILNPHPPILRSSRAMQHKRFRNLRIEPTHAIQYEPGLTQNSSHNRLDPNRSTEPG